MVDGMGYHGTYSDCTVVLYKRSTVYCHLDASNERPVQDERAVHAPVHVLARSRGPTHQTVAARAVRAMARGRR